MPSERFHADDLKRLLRQRKIATMQELKEALGTRVDLTVFRKLRELSYRTSYSHRGSYYTLDEITRFDDLGLWPFRSVWFSTYGTLLSTTEALVDGSGGGYFAAELENVLHVSVKASVVKLFRENRISRKEITGRYLYLSSQPDRRREQLAARSVHDAAPSAATGLGTGLRVVPDELKAAIILFFTLLDEKQRRLYAGLESLKMGHGGDQSIADLLGLRPGTVARGRRALLERDVELDRVRRKGGGRKALEKKRRK